MKKSIVGHLFNRIEKIGGKEVNHIGFEGESENFGELLASLVPEIGMKKKVEITIRLLE